MFHSRGVLHAAAVTVASMFAACGAMGQTYTNSAPISIPHIGTATPYPSTINVSGATTAPGSIAVTLTDVSHTYFADLDVLLVGPAGQSILLLANAAENTSVSNVNLTFASDGTQVIPLAFTPVVTGTYAPSVHELANVFPPGPAPAGPYETTFASALGANPNGQWRLFVWDDSIADAGSISGGWSITFVDSPLPTTPLDTSFTYQGVLTDASGARVTGNADVRFAVWDSATGENVANRRGGPVTVSNVPVNDGLFSTSVNLGSAVPADRKAWIEIEIASPPGSGFEKLSPRQPLSLAPMATKVSSSPFALGALVGSSGFEGVNYQAFENRGIKARVGWAIDSAGFGEFLGMQAILAPGTNFCGNSGDLAFFTWECNTATSREIMRINGRGNVGIGTNTPSQRLTVSGNILANNVAVPSSGRFKHNVVPMADALEKVLKLDGVTFDWNDEFAMDRPGREHDIGFVAEDVAKIFPEVVFYGDDGLVTGMDYSRLTAVAVSAIKQQQAQRNADKAAFEAELAKRDAEAAKRDAENAELKARLERLERALESRGAAK